jgi:hypothetical protein
MSKDSTALLIVTLVLSAIVAAITYVAINVTMDWHGAGLVVSGYVIFGSLLLGCVGGFIASFFEEAN